MRKFIFGSLLMLVVGASAHAQDFGLTAGFSQSKAKITDPNFSDGDGVFGFRLGGVVAVPLMDQVKFRSGLIYAQRHFEMKVANSTLKTTAHFDYLDIPAMVQFNFTESFGVFGGLIAAINVNNKVDSINGVSVTANSTKGLYPLLQLGVNGTFDNMFGIEAYYEMGLGEFTDGAKDYSVFGANFIYWL